MIICPPNLSFCLPEEMFPVVQHNPGISGTHYPPIDPNVVDSFHVKISVLDRDLIPFRAVKYLQKYCNKNICIYYDFSCSKDKFQCSIMYSNAKYAKATSYALGREPEDFIIMASGFGFSARDSIGLNNMYSNIYLLVDGERIAFSSLRGMDTPPCVFKAGECAR